MTDITIYILIMAATTYVIRMLPIVLLRRPIKNRYIRSFLYYMPYVTLAVMTFPAIMDATDNPVAGLLAMAAGIIAAWFKVGLLPVAVICSAVVFVVQLI